MKNRLAARLHGITKREIGWRAGSAARTLAERLRYVVQRPSWDRRALRRVLRADAFDESMTSAIARNDWPAVNTLLADRLRSRPSRFVLDPASVASMRDHVLACWPDAERD